MGDEQTVLAAVAAVPSHRVESGMVPNWPDGDSWETWTVLGSQPELIVEALGLDPSMSVGELRRRLAIADRLDAVLADDCWQFPNCDHEVAVAVEQVGAYLRDGET